MTDDGRQVLARILASPPKLHALHGEGTDGPMGLWAAEVPLYELLAAELRPGTRSLETGLGVSTVLFVAAGAEHTCVVNAAPEAERLLEHCRAEGIATDRLDLRVGDSGDVLPALEPTPIDILLIDGGHGFPVPILDFHYGARRIVEGGVLVIDDLGLPAVRAMVRFVDADPRWERIARNRQWAAYRRIAPSAGTEDWWQQQWAPSLWRMRLRTWPRLPRYYAGRVARRLGLRR
jgi:predicted O-methyltransferase YrrM